MSDALHRHSPLRLSVAATALLVTLALVGSCGSPDVVEEVEVVVEAPVAEEVVVEEAIEEVVPEPETVPAAPLTPAEPISTLPTEAETRGAVDLGAPGPSLSAFRAGAGPRVTGNTLQLLDAAGTPDQSNAVAFDREHEGAYETLRVSGEVRVTRGGDGGAIVLLNTAEHGERGPAPFVRSWVEPNLTGALAVGIDVHNPKNEEPFGPWGNYLGMPEREISLHFDGRELVKRVAPVEFRDGYAPFELQVEHTTGGAYVTFSIAGGLVYDRYFVAHLLPYESRLAFGAGTRSDVSTEFDVRGASVEVGPKATPRRPPVHVEVFNHVLTDNSKTAFEAEVQLPPREFGFERVILTLDIHDAGPNWDEWDRNGEISLITEDGERRGIVPFITSYRTPCHWKVDVSHFRPWLAGKVKFEVRAGTTFYKNRGYMMSVGLDFHHGVPELEPFDVVPLWHGTAKYESAENHFRDFFVDRQVEIPEGTQAARIFTTTTGHSQIGEFTPSRRSIEFVPDGAQKPARFENVLWKTDCYLNPNRPQYGTWKYARAGWAPGDVVWPWWIDLSPMITPGSRPTLRYLPQPYDFSGMEKPPEQKQINQASHVVRSYLILYRKATDVISAPTLLVGSVDKDTNAERAGMKAGDYLAEYDGRRIDSIDDLRAALQAGAASGREKIPAVIYRGVERMEIELEPGRMGVRFR